MKFSNANVKGHHAQGHVIPERYMIDYFRQAEGQLLTSNEKLVLLITARFSDGRGEVHWPGYKGVGQYAGMHASTVRRCFDKLIELGLIKYEGEGSKQELRLVYPVLWHNLSDKLEIEPAPKIFQKPKRQEVIDYLFEQIEKGKELDFNADDFINHYEAKDWYVGKSKMKNWKAAVRTWIRNREKWASEPDPVSDALDGMGDD